MNSDFNIDSLREAAMLSSEAPLESSSPAKAPAVEPTVDDSPLTIDGIVFPHEASQRIKAMSPDERATWDAERFRARVDPIYLANEVCGNMELQDTPHRALFQQLLPMKPGTPLADLDQRFKKHMVLWQRELGKTFCCKVFELQIILNYPNVRICFQTGSDILAMRQLEALKKLLREPSDKLKYLFPEFVLTSVYDKKEKRHVDVQPDWGTRHEFSVPCRTSNFAEPTVSISTAKSVQSGSHYDIIVIDDLVNNTNYRNAAALKKCYEDYLQIIPLLTTGGYIVMLGTRYAHGDTYQMILEHAEEIGELNTWKFSIRDCWSTGCRNCVHTEVWHDKSVNIIQGPCTHEGCNCLGFQSDGVCGVLFPQIIKRDGQPFGCTLEGLARIQAESGKEFFAFQYENNPLAAGNQIFTQELLGKQTLHHKEDLMKRAPSDRVQTYICGDLAYSTNIARDESVIYVFSKYAGQLFVWGAVFGRWTPSERIGKILELIKQVRPTKAFFEKNLNSDSMQLALEARMREFNLVRLPIEWIEFSSNRKDAKVQRIESVEGVLKSGRLWLCSWIPGFDKLEKQLLQFPNVQHDDFCDCLSMCCECPTNFLRETTPVQHEQQNADNWLRSLSNPNAVDGSYYDGGGGSGLCM